MDPASATRGGHSTHDETERRWTSLMENCSGDWSGSIGWYDYNDGVLELRGDSFQRNMRLSFRPSPNNPDIADWIVYHARARGVREAVQLEKHPTTFNNNNVQLFYTFDQGIVGRTGRDFTKLPVIEHGFWADGTRRTVVLVYTKDSVLQKICFLQQEKQSNADFDVSVEEPSHVSILPKQHDVTLAEMQSTWRVVSDCCETISSDGVRSSESKNGGALARLLQQHDPGQLCLVLPNGVILNCPVSLPVQERFTISMGYRRDNSDQVQVVEFEFQEKQVQRVQASWIKLESGNKDKE